MRSLTWTWAVCCSACGIHAFAGDAGLLVLHKLPARRRLGSTAAAACGVGARGPRDGGCAGPLRYGPRRSLWSTAARTASRARAGFPLWSARAWRGCASARSRSSLGGCSARTARSARRDPGQAGVVLVDVAVAVAVAAVAMVPAAAPARQLSAEVVVVFATATAAGALGGQVGLHALENSRGDQTFVATHGRDAVARHDAGVVIAGQQPVDAGSSKQPFSKLSITQ